MQAKHATQQHRLARPGTTHDGHNLAAHYLEIEPIMYALFAKRVGQATDMDNCIRHRPSLTKKIVKTASAKMIRMFGRSCAPLELQRINQAAAKSRVLNLDIVFPFVWKFTKSQLHYRDYTIALNRIELTCQQKKWQAK